MKKLIVIFIAAFANLQTLSSYAQVTSITGTSGQVNASASTGAITLSTPQSIGTTSTPTFGGLTLTGSLKTTAFVTSDASKTLINYTETETNIHARGSGGIIFKNNSNLQVGALSATGSLSVSGSLSGQSALFSGDVGIGTTAPTEKLSVNGKIRAKEIKVETSGWPDYVFAPDYKLADLNETVRFIREHKHLPGIPSASEVEENGINLGEMNAKLLQKIEELTLYVIDLKQEVDRLKRETGKKK